MLLTKAQLTLWWRTWSTACKAQGWTRENGWNSEQIDAKRHEILKELGYKSLRDVDNRGFDKLLSRTRLLASRLEGAIDEVQPSNGDARRLLWRIEWLIKCLEVYIPGRGETYVDSVVSDKFDHTDKFGNGVLHPRQWRELSAVRSVGKEDSELDQLRMTLTARLNGRTGYRSRQGHTIHEMCTRAGVPCACDPCKDARAAAARTPKATPAQPRRKAAALASVGAPGEVVENDPF